MTSYFQLTHDAGIATLIMCRPERRNVLSRAHLVAWNRALDEIRASKARGLIIAADGPVFSAGHDFADVHDHELSQVQDLLEQCTRVMNGLQALPQVTLAAVDGMAIAAGCQLVASCDLAVASSTATFAVPGGRAGWFCTSPGVGLVRAIGRKRALEMLLTGDPIDAETAREWGLVNRVVAPAALMDEALSLIKRATRGSRRSKAVGKRAFYRQADFDTASAYAYACEVMAAASQTTEARESIRAFLEKRTPNFGDD